MLSVRCRCQISGGVEVGGGGGQCPGIVKFFKPLKVLIVKFLEIRWKFVKYQKK